MWLELAAISVVTYIMIKFIMMLRSKRVSLFIKLIVIFSMLLILLQAGFMWITVNEVNKFYEERRKHATERRQKQKGPPPGYKYRIGIHDTEWKLGNIN